jgi:predicted MPP superfamily phosphohydrolase
MIGKKLLSAIPAICFAITLSHGQATQPAPGVQTQNHPELKLPLEHNSVRLAVIGDNGTGDQGQYDVAQQMEIYRKLVGYDFVIMLGDNIYGGHHPKDFERKFEEPYKPLLDAGVKFYASLGNHDNSNEIQYKPFNMNGQRYYSFKKGDVQFFVLDSNYMDPTQLDWIQRQLSESGAKWKICYFHHPLYSDGKFHGADVDLRKQLAPIFAKYGVNAVFSGHDHVYERFKPEEGIYYFLLGSSGQLRAHNLRRSSEMVAGDDTHRTFMVVEITGDKLYFQTIANDGSTIDSGVLQHQPKPANPPAAQAQAAR